MPRIFWGGTKTLLVSNHFWRPAVKAKKYLDLINKHMIMKSRSSFNKILLLKEKENIELKSDYEKLQKQVGGKGASEKVASLVFKSLI